MQTRPKKIETVSKKLFSKWLKSIALKIDSDVEKEYLIGIANDVTARI